MRVKPLTDLLGLPAEAFDKEDTQPDHVFYAEPRFVTHIDGHAIAAVTALYRSLFPAGGAILDLMSSWVSHFPREISYSHVFGLGLNEAELAANPQLHGHLVQNLNENQLLPFDGETFDAAAICVSIQYLQRPVVVLREAARVLKKGGPLAITFSNRCFPTKAVAVWQALPDEDHARLVTLYLEAAGFSSIEVRELVPKGQVQMGQRLDPLWAVIGRA
jgi:SAM-dependent methyltransferase